jgi:hypothetical protein
MKRRSFLKSLMLGTCAMAGIDHVKADTEKPVETYKFDDIFYRPYDTNQSLVYVKNDSFLAGELYNCGIDKDFKSEFTGGIYLPVRSLLIKVKDEYTKSDFECILAYLNNNDYKSFHLIPYDGALVGKSPMRFFQNKNGYLTAEFLYKNNY